MVTIQKILKVKTLFHCFIKKFFNLTIHKLIIFLFLFILSCSSYANQVKEIQPLAVKCGISNIVSKTNNQETLTIKNQKFRKKLQEIGFANQDLNYNIYVGLGLRGNRGYALKFDKLLKKEKILEIYFTEVKPDANTLSAAVPIYPYCLLKIEKFDEIGVIIN